MDFSLKPIIFFGRSVAIVCQNENGPCPLLALANILLLEGKITINPDRGVISLAELTQILANCILEKIGTSSLPEHIKLLESVLNILPKLANGLDLNVIFSGVDKFEFTEEISVFDALGIPLLHGWIYDSQQDVEIATAIGNLSYNHLLFHLVEYKSLCEKLTNFSNSLSEGGDTELNPRKQGEVPQQQVVGKEQHFMKEGEIFEKFFEATASQFTYPGMLSLYNTMHDRQFAIFFRNNHFSTLFFYNGQLFMLVTDLGYRHESSVVWEVLDSIDGATEFYNAEFVPLSLLPSRTPVDYTQIFTSATNAPPRDEASSATGGTFASPPADAKYSYGTRASLPTVIKAIGDAAVSTNQADGHPSHNNVILEGDGSATAGQRTETTEDFEIVDMPATEALTPSPEGGGRMVEGDAPTAVAGSAEVIPAISAETTAPSSVSAPEVSASCDAATPLSSSGVPNENNCPVVATSDGADRPRVSSVDADFLLAIQLQEQEDALASVDNNNNSNSGTIPVTTVPFDHLHPSTTAPAGSMAAMMTQEESDRQHALRLHYEEMDALSRQQQQQNNTASTGRSHAYTTFAASQSGGFPYNQSRQQPSNARSPRAHSGAASSRQKKDSCVIF